MVKRKGDQTEEAVNRMESLGLPSKFVRNIIHKSLKLYGGWEFLQAENYQVLADLCFEEMDAEKEKASAAATAAAAVNKPCSDHRQAADRSNAQSGVSFRCDLVCSPSKGKAKSDFCSEDEEQNQDKEAKEMILFTVEPIQTMDPSASRLPLKSFLGVGLRRSTTPCPFEEDFADDSPQVPEAHSSHPSNDDSSYNQIVLFTETPENQSIEEATPPENQPNGEATPPENQPNGEATPLKLGIAFVKANPRALMLIAGNYSDDDEDE